jgi:hypothetical protein
MNCIFYDKTLKKQIPCILIPGKIFSKSDEMSKKLYVQVYFNSSKFVEYNVTIEKLERYSSEFVNIHDLYPANTQAQINYANAVIPNLFTTYSDELDRYESLINMITDVVGDISKDVFYLLSDLVSYELLFTKCTLTERQFMMSLTTSQLVEQPVSVLIPQMIRMTKRLFEKYTSAIDSEYDLDNYNNYYIYKDTLPITLNIDNLKFNVNYIII